MTVTNTVNRSQLTGDGAVVAFAFTFTYFATSDLGVYLDGVKQTEVTHYTVAPTSGSSGTVTFGTAPGSGVLVTMIRELPLTQGVDLPTGGKFPADTVEEGLDRAMAAISDVSERIDRSIVQSVESTLTDIEIPAPAALQGWRWNAAADNLENVNFASVGLYIDPVTTRGDLIRGSTSGVQERLARGARGSLLVTDTNDALWKALGTRGALLYAGATDPLYLTAAAQHAILVMGADDPGWLVKGTDDQVLTMVSGAAAWADAAAAGIFAGTGSDGATTISSNTTVNGIKNYSSLTIDSTFTLTHGNDRAMHLKVSGTVTVNGTIGAVGKGRPGAAAGATGTVGGAGAGGGGGSDNLSSAGGAGGGRDISFGGGGAGATGSGNVGGTGSAAWTLLADLIGGLGNPMLIKGGAGGGGGGGGAAVGGRGGGIIIIECDVLTIASGGVVSCAGAVGGSSGTSGGAGGGGGGILILRYRTLNNSGTISVVGGLGGGSGGDDGDGGPGGAGILIQEVVP